MPEDRLRIALLGAIFAPATTLACGLVTDYVPGTLGIVLNVVVLFLNGISVRTWYTINYEVALTACMPSG